MAGEQNPDVTAYALIVPMIKVNTGKTDYSRVQTIATVIHSLGLGSLYAPGHSNWPSSELVFGRPNACNSNPETAQTRDALFAMRENLRTNGITMGWLYETATSTETLFSPEHLAAINQPVKMFTAGIDYLVDTAAAQQFCNSLAQCDVDHLAESRHCVNLEKFELYDSVILNAISHFDQQI
jgi:alpha-beta hydrolase superfamily lysophospholipase